MIFIRSRKDSKYIPDGKHTKYINKNNDYVPSVTNILKVIPKDNLIYWANNLGWSKISVKKELERTAIIGTKAHNFIEKIISGENIIPESDSEIFNMLKDHPYELRNSILSFIKWWNINKDHIELVAIEKSMSCDDYGGTCDLICKYDGELMIVDFKTSGDFYFSMYIQLAAYVNLYKKYSDEKVKDVAVLRLDKKFGNIAEFKRLSEIKNGSIDYYYTIFDNCLKLYESLNLIQYDWK